MICPKCNFQNQEGVQFCTNCGTPSLKAPSVSPISSVSDTLKQPFPSQKGSNLRIFLILIIVGSIAASLGMALSRLSKRSESPATSETATPTPTGFLGFPATSPTPTPPPVIKQINTLEEAMSYALTGSGMQYADTAKVDGINLLYTPTYKNWTFKFISRANPHKSEKTFATVYDEVWTTVKVTNTGEVNVDVTSTFKDQPEEGSWLYKPKPAEAALSSYLDLAKQKVTGAGLTPGQIISAEFSSLGVKDDTGGYNNQWKVAVVLAGEEGNTQKKAKTVSFMGGNFNKMYDSTVTIY